MKTHSLLGMFLGAALAWIPLAGKASDTLHLLGLPKGDLLKQKGLPTQILGPEEGYQTYEYPDGLSVVLHDAKVVQYVIKGSSAYTTDKGVRLGSNIDEVTKRYGGYRSTEAVEQWFAGNKQQVLYHHPKFDRYKINYADSDLIFLFDKNQKVEMIWVGYIFPIE